MKNTFSMFSGFSQEECLIRYKDLIENSEQKWKSAQTLASNHDFGGAISYLTISIEKLAKGLIVLLEGKGFEIRRVNSIDVFLRKNHSIRFLMAFLMFALGVFGEDALQWINKIRDNPESEIKKLKVLTKDKKSLEKKIKIYFLRKWVKLSGEINWFSQLEVFRQNGFYTDFLQELKSPLSLTDNDYMKVLQRLELVRKVGIFIISALEENNSELDQALIRLKESVEGFYPFLEIFLQKLQKKRDAFSLINLEKFDLRKL